ncbi:MAG: hypothetical protein N3F64_07630, partial [Nitrososphaeria archaeon]|nr:hypothetical protein [Nitrososphaeria archaeon]
VILIAIAVTLSLAIAFWSAGLTGAQTGFEEIRSLSSYVIVGYKISGTSSIKYYNVTFLWQNTGTADTTIIDIYLNGKSLKLFWPSAEVYINDNLWISSSDTGFKEISFPSGSKLDLVIVFLSNPTDPFRPGQTIEVEAVTSRGIFYVTLFNIP